MQTTNMFCVGKQYFISFYLESNSIHKFEPDFNISYIFKKGKNQEKRTTLALRNIFPFTTNTSYNIKMGHDF